KTRPLARVAHPENFLRATDSGDQRAPEQSLKIKRDIRLQPPRLPHPRQQTAGRAESAKFAARKNVDMIDVAISAQERRPFRIDDPGNFRIGVSIANGRNRWQSV